MLDQQKVDAVICGAGIAGVSTAYFLSKFGIDNILLVDKLPPFSLTSSLSAECYRNWWPDQCMVDFTNHSIDLLEEIYQIRNMRFYFNRRGYAFISLNGNSTQKIIEDTNKKSQLGLGIIRTHSANDKITSYDPTPAEGFTHVPTGIDLLLGNSIIKKNYPFLSEEATILVHARKCGWISAQELGTNLLTAAKEQGVTFVQGEVVGSVFNKEKISYIKISTDDGVKEVSAKFYINATGPFLKTVGKIFNQDLPVVCELHEKILLQDVLNIVPRSAPMMILNDAQLLDWSISEKNYWKSDKDYNWLLKEFPPSVYLRPEGGNDSNWLLIGWSIDDQIYEPKLNPPLKEVFPEVALRGAAKLVPDLKKYLGKAHIFHDGGYYTKALDNKPIIGQAGPVGCYVVGGLSGYGIMTGSAAGELCAAHITGKDLPDYASDFSPHRFSVLDINSDLSSIKAGQL